MRAYATYCLQYQWLRPLAPLRRCPHTPHSPCPPVRVIRMWSGRVLAIRRAREAEEIEAAARSGQSSPMSGQGPWHTPSASSPVQGSQLPSPPPVSPRTVAGGSPRLEPSPPAALLPPLMPAPSSPFPPAPARWPSAPAASLGREMSQTDPLVLEALLPLLSPASGGSASETGQQPSMGVGGELLLGWVAAVPAGWRGGACMGGLQQRPTG